MKILELEEARIAVIGLGYVGLPLAVEFGKQRPTIGFDINLSRIDALRKNYDATLEVEEDELQDAKFLSYTSNLEDLAACNVYIITVPTPIDEFKRPDLTPLIKASEAVGKVISKGDIVIYESTVYPGATEEDCIPVVEKVSGLKFNVDFVAGYSPERINPGDKLHRLPSIKKVTSGSTIECAQFVDQLYRTIITAGTHLAPSIKVAEASKVIENTQRDVNIALVNELAMIFNRLNINTLDVLEAAGTKWNFMPFRPGLVGGHCIGVDPYYLTHKAEAAGYHSEIVSAGRMINDGMGIFIANRLVREMILKEVEMKTARVLILGLTFKENCPDLRNTRVVDVIDELKSFGMQVDVHDPWANKQEAQNEYGIDLIEPETFDYDAIVFAVAHDTFKLENNAKLASGIQNIKVLYDLKGLLPKELNALNL